MRGVTKAPESNHREAQLTTETQEAEDILKRKELTRTGADLKPSISRYVFSFRRFGAAGVIQGQEARSRGQHMIFIEVFSSRSAQICQNRALLVKVLA